MEWRVMVVASLLHYHHDRRRLLATAAIVVALLCILCLLAYAVLAGGQTTDLSPDAPLMGPFRWLNATNLG